MAVSLEAKKRSPSAVKRVGAGKRDALVSVVTEPQNLKTKPRIGPDNFVSASVGLPLWVIPSISMDM